MKKVFSTFYLVGFLLLGANAQVDSIALRYASTITINSATKHLSILASDEFEGRDTGKPGGIKAAQYIADEFKKIGLLPPVGGSYFQNVPLVETGFRVDRFEINGQNLNIGDGFYMTGSGPTTNISSDEIVFIGYGISSERYDDLKATDITGKVVMLINKGEPISNKGISHITGTDYLSEWTSHRYKRLQNILAKRPALILAVSPDVSNMISDFRDRLSKPSLILKEKYKEATHSPGIAHLTPETANLLLKSVDTSYDELVAKINKQGKPQTFPFKSSFHASYGTQVTDVPAPNVLGYLEGRDLKDELLVISAHYDHVGIGADGKIFNGADDDASGTTGIIEIANAFAKSKKDGHGPRRSILFLAFTGEEKGLLGSDHYTRYPVFPLKNTVTDLNIDMIGRVDPEHEGKSDYIYLIGSDKLSSTLHQVSEEANEKYTNLYLNYKFNDPNDPERIYYRSDHYNFAKHNIPVIFYFNGIHADYHKASDTIDKIDFKLLVKRSKLVFHTAWKIANRDQRLPVDSNKK